MTLRTWLTEADEQLADDPHPGGLTPLEANCCHFQQWGLDGQPLSQWRAEFATIPRAEKCKDCPCA